MDSINNLYDLTIDKMKEMSEENVVLGKMLKLDNILVIPISKVKCGFVGGSLNQRKEELVENHMGVATGSNMTLTPIAFLVLMNNEVKLLHLDEKSHILENLIDLIPDVCNKLISLVKNK